jgi:argininosuccinate lyase
MLPELTFDTERTEAALSDLTLATDLADHLVQEGMPFREAHGVVGGLVRRCLAEGRSLADLTPEELSALDRRLAGAPPLEAHASLARKATSGGTGPASVAEQIEAAERRIAERRAALEETL